MASISPISNNVLFAACIAIQSLITGCAAPYDEQTDKLISTLQTDVDTEVVKLISSNERIEESTDEKVVNEQKKLASYAENVSAYNKMKVDLVSLKLRIAATQNTPPDIDQALQNLNDNLFGIGSLEATHRQQGMLSSDYLATQQQIIQQQIAALLTYQLILKN